MLAEIAVGAVVLAGAAAVGLRLIKRPVADVVEGPGDGEIAPRDHILEHIARFEAELARATSQEDADNAAGRLAYWVRERDRG